jgi:Cu/Ag efflux protein CusF
MYMMRLSKLLLPLLTLAALFVLATPGWTAEEPTRGTIQSVTADKHQLVMTDRNGKSWTFHVAEQAAIFIPNEAGARLSDLKTGDDVSLLFEKKGDQLHTGAILAHRGDFRNAGIAGGTLKQVAADGREFTLTDANGKEWTYHMAGTAQVRVNNQNGKLSDFKAGDRVVLVWDKEGNQYMVKALCNCPTGTR